jgi:hypothetical protein
MEEEEAAWFLNKGNRKLPPSQSVRALPKRSAFRTQGVSMAATGMALASDYQSAREFSQE